MRGKFATKSADLYASLCAEFFRRFLVRFRPDTRESMPNNRAETVAALEQALARRGRRVAIQKRLTQVGVYSAAAGVLLALGWIWSRHSGEGSRMEAMGTRAYRALTVLSTSTSGTVSAGTTSAGSATAGTWRAGTWIDGAVVVGGGAARQPLTNGMSLEPGTGLVAPATTEVRIGTADGTVLTLERSGEMTVVQQDTIQRFALNRGAVRAQVAKLQGRERFIITTDDATVEVHGTVFRVAVVASDPTCGGGVRTRVSVFEGVVSVRARNGEAFVPAGRRWPDGCAESAPSLSTTTTTTTASNGSGVQGPSLILARTTSFRGAPRSAVTSRRGSSVGDRHVGAAAIGVAAASTPISNGPWTQVATESGASSPSVLAAQNDLFLGAIRAKRQQRNDEAVRLFSKLIDTYPDGPLVEGAMAQRMGVLRGVGGGGEAATRAASQYLARFPGGFARAEAQQLLGSGP